MPYNFTLLFSSIYKDYIFRIIVFNKFIVQIKFINRLTLCYFTFFAMWSKFFTHIVLLNCLQVIYCFFFTDFASFISFSIKMGFFFLLCTYLNIANIFLYHFVSHVLVLFYSLFLYLILFFFSTYLQYYSLIPISCFLLNLVSLILLSCNFNLFFIFLNYLQFFLISVEFLLYFFCSLFL